jgi:6-pyruvoyltetrahydropterin/6-carboxytetrahydropterin synthase
MKITITKNFDFEAAHQEICFPEGHKCRNVHGHTFRLWVSVTGEVDRQTGLFYDHAKISEAVAPLVAGLDHTFLNESLGMKNMTMEFLAEWFWKQLHSKLPGLSEIRIQETPRAEFVYRGE